MKKIIEPHPSRMHHRIVPGESDRAMDDSGRYVVLLTGPSSHGFRERIEDVTFRDGIDRAIGARSEMHGMKFQFHAKAQQG